MTPTQTPWYQNPVVWSSYLATAASFFFAFSPLIVQYPGVPGWAITGVGIVGGVLTMLGYQNHSSEVRKAELNLAAFTPAPVSAGEFNFAPPQAHVEAGVAVTGGAATGPAAPPAASPAA